jgi:transposase
LTVDNIDVDATIKKVQELLALEPNLSPALRSMLDMLLLVVQLLANRLSLNSRNSSKPPSTDFVKGDKKAKDGNNKPGGQPGRVGTTLNKVDDPDEIKLLKVNRSSLPPAQYRDIGFESRQVFDIVIQRVVTEYRAQILEAGSRYF